MTDTVAISVGYQSSGFGVAATTTQTIRHSSDTLDNSGQILSASDYGGTPEPVIASQGALTGQGTISGNLRSGNSNASVWEPFIQGTIYADTPSLTPTNGTAPITTVGVTQGSPQTFDKTAAWSGITVGDWVYSTGFSTAANNGMFKVTAVNANSIEVVGGTLVTEAAGASKQVEPATVFIPGDTLSYWSIEKAYTVGTNKYAVFKDCVPNLFELTANDKGTIKVRTGFVSSPGVLQSSALATPTTASTQIPFTFIDNFVTLIDGDGTAYNTPLTCIRGYSLRVQNGAFGAECLESVSPYAFGKGDITISGSISLAFKGEADAAIFNKIASNTVSAVAFGVARESSKRGWLFEVPEVTYHTGSLPSSKGQTNQIDIQFGAKKESGGTSIKFCRFENS